ncbi:MAG: glycosyltransferase family 4 protein [Gemmatimonadetes bacterium]|nr:glycosyltransferase family 4 protein [Gemmatimonadota bacterium]
MFGRLAARHQVSLLVSGWSGGAPRTCLDELDVHRTGGRHTFSLAAPRYYLRHLKNPGFDVVVEDLNKVPVFAPLWAGRPVVLLVHHLFGRTAFQEASPPFAAATWLLERPLPWCYRGLPVEAVSESTAADLAERGFRRDRMAVIENGVDIEYYVPDPTVTRFPEPTALYLGRLKRYKRIDLILRAVARLRAEGLQFRLIVTGQGDAATELRRLRAELDLQNVVDFPGYVSEAEKRTLFRRAWVHVLTSPKEGWGISNLEAAACGTATVASDSPGLRDSVLPEQTGYLVPHGDVAALAERLRLVLTSPELRDQLGDGARRFAERFTWQRAALATEAHLQSVLDRVA